MARASGIVRASLGEQVSEALRELILMGSFEPGEALTHDRIAKQLGVSAMPVREALLRLTQEGFLENGPSRSFRVAHVRRKDITDIYWLHAKISGELNFRACESGTRELIRDIVGAQAEWESTDPDDGAALSAINFRFHRAINKAADAPKLTALLQITINQIPQRFYELMPQWKEASSTSHREIIDAFKARDSEAARSAAEEHIRQAGLLLIDRFDESGYWAEPTDPKTA